jgi:DnaJ-class molecular chaperone
MVLSHLEAEQGGLFSITVPVLDVCMRCERSGLWEGFFCPLCFGTGRVNKERQFTLTVPPRIRDGTRITLSMEDIGLKTADIHILVTVSPFSEEQDGRTIISRTS